MQMQPAQKNHREPGGAATPFEEAVRQAGGAVDGRQEIRPNANPLYLALKRAFDVAASCAALAVFSPLMLLTALAIKIEDPKGPVFYNAPRGGKDGVPFICHKFRSMYANADAVKAALMGQNEMDGPVFKIRNDPRVTRVGRIIRKTSIDELPQLYDVLRGKMSLVGPRPLPVEEAQGCDAYQRQRELVKPGLTCYWQVSGRNRVSFEEWIELDMKYIRERSVWTDLKILAATIPAVLSGGGLVSEGDTFSASVTGPRAPGALIAVPSGG